MRDSSAARPRCNSLEEAEGHVVEPGEGLQLYEIDSSLAGLTFGEEGLRLLERLGSLHLGQTGLQPRLLEPEPELGIGGLVVGEFQGEAYSMPLLRGSVLFTPGRHGWGD